MVLRCLKHQCCLRVFVWRRRQTLGGKAVQGYSELRTHTAPRVVLCFYLRTLRRCVSLISSNPCSLFARLGAAALGTMRSVAHAF